MEFIVFKYLHKHSNPLQNKVSSNLFNVSQMFVYLGEKKNFQEKWRCKASFFIFSIVRLYGLFSFHFDFIPFSSITPKWVVFSCFELDLKKKTQFSVKCINNGFPMQVLMTLSQSDRRNRILFSLFLLNSIHSCAL